MKKNLLYILFLGLLLWSCKPETHKPKIQLYNFIPTETSYVFQINKNEVLNSRKPELLNQILGTKDRKFIKKLHFTPPFLINAVHIDDKVKGFVAVGNNIKQTDSLFNGKTSVYEQQNVYSENFNGKEYYATSFDNILLVSDNQMFIENVIRQQTNPDRQISAIFKRGVGTIDNTAALNIFVNPNRVDSKDILYKNLLQPKAKDLARWEFYDVPEYQKEIYTGVSLTDESMKYFLNVFQNLESVENDCLKFVPGSVSQSISLSFDDFAGFYQNLNEFAKSKENLREHNLPRHFSGLNAINYFTENSNKACILFFEDAEGFLDQIKFSKIGNYGKIDIQKLKNENLINNSFDVIFPKIKTKYFFTSDNYVIFSETEAYLQKIINDFQNKAALKNNQIYQRLKNQMPDNYNLLLIDKHFKIGKKEYIKARTYQIDQKNIFANLLLEQKVSKKNDISIEQFLSYKIKDTPITKPQFVLNHNTQKFEIIYQNENHELILINLTGKQLWKTKLDDKIIGKIYQVDLLKNHKLQLAFTTPHYLYVIDRLGRNVEPFPKHFNNEITRGLNVFDYDHNRKYRFAIVQERHLHLYDANAKEVKDFKAKIKETIIQTPQHYKVSGKDFIGVQGKKGKFYLLDRKGKTRIDVEHKFNVSKNHWGIYHKKFVNIDNAGNLVSIDLKGNVKSDKLNLGGQIFSEIKHHTLAALGDGKLLINNQIKNIDLGTYSKPKVVKTGKQIYVVLSNSENEKIYLFDTKAKIINKFPVMGQRALDFRTDGKGNRYLLVYDANKHLLVYEF